jgi:DNA-dependent RNA polymerase auxiliary subunit epsilon
MEKLYEVTVSFFVDAESDSHAREIVEDHTHPAIEQFVTLDERTKGVVSMLIRSSEPVRG